MLCSQVRQNHSSGVWLVIKYFCITPPFQRRVQLALNFFFREVFVENVLEKVDGNGVICFGMERLIDLTQQLHMAESGFPE